ncbi:hypothetical protein EX30DRAFT_337218 [Ascodesmis nigricans]|uniref:Uncharacterized protein n=1 Tax=Ascodesmis nigricans TaxID=341454 RepID=A0A4S2N6B9_9PEZI|nr:hypothetical protein EX30DRAFT_337218 [Ascodesmis nigricans]
MSYRPPGRSSRSSRTTHDHDVFDGLPVRRWTKQWVTIHSRPPAIPGTQPDHPLPKDAALLSETSRGLLAAARNAGTPNTAEASALQREREQAQAQAAQQSGAVPLFQTKQWALMPKHLEAEIPEPVYLSKVPGGLAGKRIGVGSEKGEEKGRLIVGGAGGGSRRRNPPPPNKKKTKRGRKKKVDIEREAAEKTAAEAKENGTVETVDVEMVDVDAATKEAEVPVTAVGEAVENLEIIEEKKALEEKVVDADKMEE